MAQDRIRWVILPAVATLGALTLQGCGSVYKETCVWHSDLNINGCGFYSFRSCIHHCHYCVTASGPDECAQLQCASYCARRNGPKCLSNFTGLCRIAVQENFAGGGTGTCRVDCSGAAAPRPQRTLLLLAAGGLLLSTLRGSHAPLALLGLFAAGTTLQGCCTKPAAQLKHWTPDYGDFRRMAEWVDDSGLWLGNPKWHFTPELEVEDYECQAIHSDRPVCVVWTTHEWNCGEHDFGICKCYTMPATGDFCQEWGCHSLEADQKICHENNNDDGDVSCSYNPFPMNLDTYNRLLENQMSGSLTTGESARWWSLLAFSFGHGRRLEENATAGGTPAVAGNASNLLHGPGEPRELSPLEQSWPPPVSYTPAMRHRFFHWGEVCIVNGDNTLLARHRCTYWREIETEISHCRCQEAHIGGKACARWSCEERDVGLFSVLFRTRQPISQFVSGTEMEEYRCVGFDLEGRCTAWEGRIASLEEVEWTRCECTDGHSCHGPGAVWRCDEYELPKRRAWNHKDVISLVFMFGTGELVLAGLVVYAFNAGEDAPSAAVFGSCCCGLLVLPFLVVTLGAYGFLALGLPFWLLRLCCCSVAAGKLAGSGGARRRPMERLRSGTFTMLGRSASYDRQVSIPELS